jgi:PAS domain S-box-containing protein
MKKSEKTKEQLIMEIAELQKRNKELEISDISRMQKEQILRESETKYRLLVESSTDMLFTVDLKGRFLFVNNAFKKCLGYSKKEMMKINGFALVHPDDQEKVRRQFGQITAGKTVNNMEYRYKTKSGKYIHILNNATPVSDSEGNIVAALGIARDISPRKKMEEELQKAHDELEHRVAVRTAELLKLNEKLNKEIIDRKRIEKALRESEEKYRAIFESFHDVYYRTDKEGLVTIISPSVRTHAGYNPEDIIGYPVTDFYLNPEDRETFVQKLKEKGAVNDYELKLKAKDGSVIETSMSAHIIFRNEGEPIGVEGVLRDITERKRAEEALKESEEKYRDLVENLAEVIYALNPSGKVLYVSPAVKSLIGYTPKEIEDQSFVRLIHEDDLPQASKRIQKILSGASVTGEYRIRAKSGQIRWIRTTSRPVFKKNHITGVQGILTDITESKEAERELKESEKKYRELIEKSLQGVVIIQDSRIVFANKALAKITGFTAKELLSLTPERMKVLIHPEDQERVWGLLENRLTGKAMPPHYECRGIRKNGSVMWMEIFTHQIIYNGKPALQGAIIDITERKHAEEALRESEEKYKTLVETSPDAVTATDLEGKITYASQQTISLYGYRNAKELIGKSALDLIAPEEHERAMKKLQRILKEGIIKNEEYILLKKDGTRLFGELSAALVRDSEENPKMFIVTIRDITERKKAEEAMQFMQFSIDHTADAAFWMGKDARFTYVNDAACRALRYSRKELLNMSVQDIDPDFPAEVWPEHWKEVKRRGSFSFESHHRTKKGRVFPVEVTVNYLEFGGKEYNCAFAKDITERKKTEETLRESEEKYRAIFESINDVYFRTDSDGRVTLISPSVRTQAGWAPEEIIGKLVADFYINPDDHKKTMEKLHESGVVNDYELKLLAKDGSVIEASANSNLVFDKKGRLVGLEGVLRNITERKRAEEELQAREAYLDQLFESAQEAIVMADNKGIALRINQEFTKLFGYTPRETAGKALDELIVPKKLRKSATLITEKVAKGERTAFEAIRCHKDGRMIAVSVLASPIVVGGKQIGTYGIYRNITERKKAEEQIKASLKEKEILLQEVHHRVKNNMQIISSLLNLQSRHIKDEESLELFKSSQSRVKSMALIHERLYQSKDFTRIDVADYVQNLTNHLFITYGISRDDIKLKINIKDIFLDINTAIPCALIINEIVSNSLKHAFPNGKKGEIKISMHPLSKDEVELVVGDNGVGIPEDANLRNTKSLGLYLVSMLAEDQLHGEIKLDKTEGIAFRFRLRAKNERRRN